MLVVLASAALLLAQAAPEKSGTAPVQPPTASEKPKQICRQEQQTGSNFSKRVCHTAEEWKAMADEARKQSDDFRSCRNGQGC